MKWLVEVAEAVALQRSIAGDHIWSFPGTFLVVAVSRLDVFSEAETVEFFIVGNIFLHGAFGPASSNEGSLNDSADRHTRFRMSGQGCFGNPLNNFECLSSGAIFMNDFVNICRHG